MFQYSKLKKVRPHKMLDGLIAIAKIEKIRRHDKKPVPGEPHENTVSGPGRLMDSIGSSKLLESQQILFPSSSFYHRFYIEIPMTTPFQSYPFVSLLNFASV